MYTFDNKNRTWRFLTEHKNSYFKNYLLRRGGGGSQVKILIISVFNPSKNLEYKDSGTFYGI